MNRNTGMIIVSRSSRTFLPAQNARTLTSSPHRHQLSSPASKDGTHSMHPKTPQISLLRLPMQPIPISASIRKASPSSTTISSPPVITISKFPYRLPVRTATAPGRAHPPLPTTISTISKRYTIPSGTLNRKLKAGYLCQAGRNSSLRTFIGCSSGTSIRVRPTSLAGI
jgi:hypothetical protein